MHQAFLLQVSVHLAQGGTVPFCALTQLLTTETGPAGHDLGRRPRSTLAPSSCTLERLEPICS